MEELGRAQTLVYIMRTELYQYSVDDCKAIALHGMTMLPAGICPTKTPALKQVYMMGCRMT